MPEGRSGRPGGLAWLPAIIKWGRAAAADFLFVFVFFFHSGSDRSEVKPELNIRLAHFTCIYTYS